MRPFQLNTIDDYKLFTEQFYLLPPHQAYLVARDMLRTDLFFMLTVGLGRFDAVHPWILDRCKDVENNPNGYLDLWARGHYKSTVITFAKTIQDVLASHGDNPLPSWHGVEVTVGIFSCTRPIAKQFLAQIKREFEANDILRKTFPDILWENPERDAPSWSLDAGIIVKRKSNPKEATIEAHGLVDGQPTSKHFYLCVYDDVVTIENVRSPQMIEKTTDAWALSLNLGTETGLKRYIGTRYHYNDTYSEIIRRNAAIPRVHKATIDGTIDGEPVLLTREILEQKRREMGSYVYNSQMLQSPSADESQGFKRDWLEFADVSTWNNLNRYIIVDPANEKKKNSDYTAMIVVGLGGDNNYYILDWVRDKLSLTERADVLFMLHRKFKPLNVGYEKYGMQADVAHIKDLQRRVNYNFKITELGGNLSKVDRIRQLIPIFEAHRIYLPVSSNRTTIEGKTIDLTQVFMHEEYLNFPVSLHDDMLDALARITDKDFGLRWPKLVEHSGRYQPKEKINPTSAWAT